MFVTKIYIHTVVRMTEMNNNQYVINKDLLAGITWFLLSCFVSAFNDVLTRFSSVTLPPTEISFFRFFFSFVTIFPFILYKGFSFPERSMIKFHILRCFIGVVSINFWILGVIKNPLAIASIINLSLPFYFIPLAAIFLREKISWQNLLACSIGFVGTAFILIEPSKIHEHVINLEMMDPWAYFLFLAIIGFALSDILNKKVVCHEPPIIMLFYFSLGASIFSLVPAITVWKTPNISDGLYLFLLGIGGNLVLFSLLKAFQSMKVSSLAPFRYFEFIFALGLGYFLFEETLTGKMILGSFITITSTFILMYLEKYPIKNKLSNLTS